MRFVIFTLVFLVVWKWWTSAVPLPCTGSDCSTTPHNCNHHTTEPSERTKRDVLKTVSETLKNTTKYVGKALHIINKRDGNNETTKLETQEHLTKHNETFDVDKEGNDTIEVSNLELNVTQRATNDLNNEDSKEIDIILIDKETNATERISINETTVINIKKNKREISNVQDLSRSAPCTRKKRNIDDSYITETCEQHMMNEKRKNITIIIQNLIANRRQKREAGKLMANVTENALNETEANEVAKNETAHHHKKMDKEESKNKLEDSHDIVVKSISKDEPLGAKLEKQGRKLLSHLDGNEVEETSSEEESFSDFSEEFVDVTTGNVLAPYFSTKNDASDPSRLKCTCAIYVGNQQQFARKGPLITGCLLDASTNNDPKKACSKACSDSSKMHFKLEPVIMCAHISEVHHYIDQPILMDHPHFVDETTETIVCQITTDDTVPPLRYLATWLNVVLLDIAVCLTGLSIICIYLVCFVTWKRRRLVPVYAAASFTVK